MIVTPITLRQARAFIEIHHRHNRPPRGWRFGVGLCQDGELVGVGVASRPIARALDDGTTIEIIRVATDGTRNANSQIYGALSRAAKALGYRRVITYTLDSESGASLRAVGFTEEARIPGTRVWEHTGGGQRDPMLFGDRYPIHDGDKIRWNRDL